MTALCCAVRRPTSLAEISNSLSIPDNAEAKVAGVS